MRIASRRARRGVALLEALVGFVMLALAGVAWILLVGQGRKTLRDVHEREGSLSRAELVLARAAIWSPAQFEARLGRQRQSAGDVVVSRERDALYSVAILDTLTGAELLRTSFLVRSASDTTR